MMAWVALTAAAAAAVAAAAVDSSLAAPPPPCPSNGAAGTLGKYCLPKWPPTYSMPKSTIVMPCNSSGFLDPVFAAQWGICDIDWSNLKFQWDQDNPMDCSQLLIEQARQIKAVDSATHVFVYRCVHVGSLSLAPQPTHSLAHCSLCTAHLSSCAQESCKGSTVVRAGGREAG